MSPDIVEYQANTIRYESRRRCPNTDFSTTTTSSDGPANDTESMFHFLNRAAGSSWQRVRDVIELGYSEFPDPDEDLRGRFQSDDIG